MVIIDTHAKGVKVKRSFGSKVRVETDKRTDGRMRLHYVPCLRRSVNRLRVKFMMALEALTISEKNTSCVLYAASCECPFSLINLGLS